MSLSWRNAILRHFERPTHRLILVADPDGLLAEEQVLAAIRDRGFDVMPFEDPVAFRYAYESLYRERWDDEVEPSPMLVVRVDGPDVRRLPYDLLQRGQSLRLSLHDLLPRLSYPVVRDFFRTAPELLDRLIAAENLREGARLGDRRTLAFIAREVYSLDPATVLTLNDLVERLLIVHYNGWPLPERIQHWLVEQFQATTPFEGLPVERWLADRSAFFTFIEAQWQAHLEGQGHTLAEARPGYVAGPPQVRFALPAIRATVDTLFLEGKLRPARVIAERPPADWTAVGVAVDEDAYRQQRLKRLLATVEKQLHDARDSNHRLWLDLARIWAEALVLANRTSLALPLSEQFDLLRERLTVEFGAWLRARYNTLHTLPYLPAPIVGHHAVHFLAHRLRQRTPRLAMLVLDGLALDQWQIIREVWDSQARPWQYHEQALLAVLPTVTPIARQALFAGQLPFYFADTWQRTDADERHWQRFWADQGLYPSAVAWRLGLEDAESLVADTRLRALGVVVSTVDEMLHGSAQGTTELHERVRWWAQQGILSTFIDRLLATGFEVWLTSDHGNVAAEGIGRPREGVLVERRGTRVRFYSDPAFLERARADLPEAVAWTPGGLPPSLQTLFAPERFAFAAIGQGLITHGGLALEEVVVPWVHIGKKDSEGQQIG